MAESFVLTSKVLLLEPDASCSLSLMAFFKAQNLIAIKTDSILEGLGEHKDLGAIFLSEDALQMAEAVEFVYRYRRELLIFVRSTGKDSGSIAADLKKKVTAYYTIDALDSLAAPLRLHIFDKTYPDGFLQGLQCIALDVLAATINNMEFSVDGPYLVRDRLNFGDICCALPIESKWCRGYMSLEMDKIDASKLIAHGKTGLDADDTDQRPYYQLVHELANMFWGRFKNRYVTHAKYVNTSHRSEVPIISDGSAKYLTFGSMMPQIYFKYLMHDPSQVIDRVAIHQKITFSLEWLPQNYKEAIASDEDSATEGELDFDF